MKFIRKHGRIIPIREKSDASKNVAIGSGAAGLTAAAGGASAVVAGKSLAKKAETGYKFLLSGKVPTISISKGEDIKPLLSMVRKSRALQSYGKKSAMLGAGLLGVGALAGLYSKYKSGNGKKKAVAKDVVEGSLKGAALSFGAVAASVGLLGLGAYKAGKLGRSSRLGAGLRAYTLTKAKLYRTAFPNAKSAINKFTLGLMKLGKS